MKKMLLIGLMTMMTGPFVFAQDYSTLDENAPAMNDEQMTDSQGVEAQDMNTQAFHGGFLCWANNRRGQYFSAWGMTRAMGQRHAMNKCFRYSTWCRPDGCTRY